ncbi:MAG: ATP-binding protein [Hyphomicrobiales bacterium]|nr:ATP-binding protein [Hyphomicrobiales bacterium]
MKPRIGLAWRLALIVVAALVLVQLAAVAAYVVERRDAGRPGLGPRLPEQIAALVRLADRAPAEVRRDIEAAAAASGVRVVIGETDMPPAAEEGREFALFETLVRRALDDFDRPVRVALARGLGPAGSFAGRGTHVRVMVPLAGGGVLDFTAGGEITARLLGLPVGLLAGLFGMIVALVAVLAVTRETAPLVRLAQAVDDFGHDLAPRSIEESGAPEVRRLGRAIERMQARIVTLVESRTLLLGAIAHDLGTAMTRLRLRLELIDPGPMRDRAVADLGDMARLVDDGLAFARSTSDTDRARIDLAALAANVIGERADLGAPVRLGATPPAAPILGSEIGLKRLLGNLVDNALRYAGDAEISIARAGAEWRVAVADHGPGVAEADRRRIFEPYVRLETSRNRKTGGTGLGLAIAEQIAHAHGGAIDVVDRPDGVPGAVFVLRLPATA